MKYQILTYIAILSLCTACGDGVFEGIPTPTPTPFPSQSPTPEPSPELNPMCMNPMEFEGGMLWKPESDSGGLVVLIRDEFVVPFESCYVVTKKGKEEQLRFTGFANGDRQHWRGQRKGGRYMGAVTCVDSDQLCIWQFDGDSSKRQE